VGDTTLFEKTHQGCRREAHKLSFEQNKPTPIKT